MTKQAQKTLFLSLLLAITLGLAGYFKYQELQQADETIALADHVADDEHRQQEKTIQPETAMTLAEGETIVTGANMLAQVLQSDVDIFAPPEVEKPVAKKPSRKRKLKQKRVPKQVAQAPVQPEPEKPTAPPLPFKFMGKLWGEDGYQVFVTLEDANLILKQGDYIASLYKVEAIKPPQMTLIYLPLSQQQTLNIGM